MTYTKQYIQDKIKSCELWAIKSMLAIHQFQTVDEKEYGQTSHKNNLGFSKIDAEILTSFSLQVWHRLDTKGYANLTMGDVYKATKILSPKQKAIVTKRMPKYWRQIKLLIEEK